MQLVHHHYRNRRLGAHAIGNDPRCASALRVTPAKQEKRESHTRQHTKKGHSTQPKHDGRHRLHTNGEGPWHATRIAPMSNKQRDTDANRSRIIETHASQETKTRQKRPARHRRLRAHTIGNDPRCASRVTPTKQEKGESHARTCTQTGHGTQSTHDGRHRLHTSGGLSAESGPSGNGANRQIAPSPGGWRGAAPYGGVAGRSPAIFF